MTKSSMAEQVIANTSLIICGYQLQLFHQRKQQRDPHLKVFSSRSEKFDLLQHICFALSEALLFTS